LAVITLEDSPVLGNAGSISEPPIQINMPFERGIELCKIVRNDSRWSGLPVLSTVDTDGNTVNRGVCCRRDDFVSAQSLPELVTALSIAR